VERAVTGNMPYLLGVDLVFALAFATIALAWRRFVSPGNQPPLSVAEKLAGQTKLSSEDREALLKLIASIGDPFAPPLAPGAHFRRDFFQMSSLLCAVTLLQWLWSWSVR
jgi:hypothetical protein